MKLVRQEIVDALRELEHLDNAVAHHAPVWSADNELRSAAHSLLADITARQAALSYRLAHNVLWDLDAYQAYASAFVRLERSVRSFERLCEI